jgi:hypothetical protein
MALDATRLKRMATVAATVVACMVFAFGIAIFAIALRPCRIAIAPGEIVAYRLDTTICEILPDGHKGTPATTSERLLLIGTGSENECVLVAPADGGGAAATLLRYRPDGAACALDVDGRPLPGSRAVGFFDFDLLPIPVNGDNDTAIDYARVPADHNPVSGKVRRTKSGPRPQFQFKVQKSIEWVDQNRYQQITDLVANYTFNAGWGLVQSADITLTAGIEREVPARYAVELKLDADGKPHWRSSAVARLRALALAQCAAQDALANRRRSDYATLAERLTEADDALGADVAMVPELHDAATATVAMLHGGASASGWALCLAHGPQSQRAAAANLQKQVAQAGFPSALATLPGGELAVVLGPYAQPDPLLAATVARRFPGFSPAWIEAPR